MQRLSQSTLSQARPDVVRPAYDRAGLATGVVHFGPGAFHRAHQAHYIDRIVSARPDLAISAVSLRTPDVRDALGPQDGLYTLVEQAAEPRLRVIGAIREVLVAAEDPAPVFERLTRAAYVTATVTEKGYALTADGELDLDRPDIRHDLQSPGRPTTLVGWLAEALARRRAAGMRPFVTLSCDNLPDNGGKLGRAVARFAEARGDRDLARWIAGEVSFPSSMVDSITPATDDGLRRRVASALGLADAWPIQRERFTQWVIEDRLGPDGALFADAGVTLARSVAPFERAKLRLLNGAHSTLAYVGPDFGCETVAQAMAVPSLAGFVERMMRQDVAPTLHAPELDVSRYVDDILERFRNPAIVHKLSQIAWDGSQKLPVRLLGTLADTLAAGRPIARLAVGIAAWMRFVVRQAQAGAPIVDPLADALSALGRRCDHTPADVDRFLTLRAVFPAPIADDGAVQAALRRAYQSLGDDSRAALAI